MFISTQTMVSIMLALFFASTAQGATYSLSGRFGTTTFPGPLNGGSFTGTFDFTRPSMGAFDVLLLDATNTVRAELTNANSGATFQANFGGSGYDAIQFRSNQPESSANILSLDFQLGFTGVGAVVPYPLGYPYASFVALGGNTSLTDSIVISGISVAVPEPAAWALLLSGAAALVLRRKWA